MRLPSLLKKLEAFFGSRDVEAYLVGGVVRDALLGIPTGDIDVAVKGNAQSVGRDLASAIDGHFVMLDEARGIIRVVVHDEDSVSFVDINSMPNGIEQDLRRRDFTVNAMAVPLTEVSREGFWNKVTDLYGGLSDLNNHVIRALSPSVFKDDPARLMRAPRLATQLSLTITDDTARQIRQDAHLVTTVAPERVRDELLKLLSQPKATASLRALDNLGLLSKVIPELDQARNVTQPKEHYWDVFNHLLETVGMVEKVLESHPNADNFVVNYVPRFESIDEYFSEEVSDGHNRATLLKMTALLHDIAKPATRTVESSGRIRFLGHHSEGAEMGVDILRRLRFSKRGTELVRLMVHHHLRPGQMAQKGELPTGKAIYRYFRDVEDAAKDTLYLNMADYLAARGPNLEEQEWSEHCRTIGHILSEGIERKAPETLPKLITGHDIMKAYSINSGPQVGALLRLVYEAQANGDINTPEEALDLVKVNLKSGGDGA